MWKVFSLTKIIIFFSSSYILLLPFKNPPVPTNFIVLEGFIPPFSFNFVFPSYHYWWIRKLYQTFKELIYIKIPINTETLTTDNLVCSFSHIQYLSIFFPHCMGKTQKQYETHCFYAKMVVGYWQQSRLFRLHPNSN